MTENPDNLSEKVQRNRIGTYGYATRARYTSPCDHNYLFAFGNGERKVPESAASMCIRLEGRKIESNSHGRRGWQTISKTTSVSMEFNPAKQSYITRLASRDSPPKRVNGVAGPV